MRASRVCWLALILAALAARAAGQTTRRANRPSLESPIRSVLKQEDYPWYDGEKDLVRPLLPDPSSWSNWLARQAEAFSNWIGGLFGESNPNSHASDIPTGGGLSTILFLTAGLLLLTLLWRLWRLYEPQTTKEDSRPSIGAAARIAGLAPSASLEGLDPWTQALRERAAGNLSAAVVWLFLDQLLSLERTGWIRLSSGRTARQYVSMIDDPVLAEGLRATLGLFEQVYYGHRVPDQGSVDRVWAKAEVLRRRLDSNKAEARG
jgi:hypothetical protein